MNKRDRCVVRLGNYLPFRALEFFPVLRWIRVAQPLVICVVIFSSMIVLFALVLTI
jgi:hypothetical protein